MVTEVALAAAKAAKTASEISAAAKAAETKSVIKSVADVAKDIVAEKAKGKGIENIGDVVKEIVKAEIKSAVENEVLEYFDPDVKILVNDIKKISGIIDEFKNSRLDKVEHPDPRTYEQTNKDDSGNHIDDSESLETDDSGEETNDELSDEKQSEAETIPEEIDDNSEKSESEDSAEEANDELSNEEQSEAEKVSEETDNNSEISESEDSGEETNEELSDEEQSEAEKVSEETNNNSETSESKDSAEEANDELSDVEQPEAESVPEETDNNSEKSELNDSNEKSDGKKADSENNESPDNNIEIKRSSELISEEKPLHHEKSFIPRTGGEWSGEPGNSDWYPDKDSEPGDRNGTNPEHKTWEEILDKYGIDNIPFVGGEPDFSEVSKGTVEIDDFSDDRDDNFTQADEKLAKQRGCTPEEVAEWRKENGYTWHECRDCKTMQKVPTEVHGNIPHSGGVSEYKSQQNNS